MFDLIVKGGPVLWFIMGLSILSLVVIIERLLFFKNIRTDEGKLFAHLKTSLEKGHYEEALSICDRNVSPLASLVKVGIEHRHYPEPTLREFMRDSVSQEIPRLEKNVSVLDTVAHIAPLCGLLGTVTGCMQAFGVLGTFGAVSDPTFLAKGISEALVTTVGGIVVAVPAVIFFNYFTGKVNRALLRLDYQVNELVLLIGSGAARKEGGAASEAERAGRLPEGEAAREGA
jgi:biopolymer transport protein ExbB